MQLNKKKSRLQQLADEWVELEKQLRRLKTDPVPAYQKVYDNEADFLRAQSIRQNIECENKKIQEQISQIGHRIYQVKSNISKLIPFKVYIAVDWGGEKQYLYKADKMATGETIPIIDHYAEI